MAERESFECSDNPSGSNVSSPQSSADSRPSSARNHSHRLSFVSSNLQHRPNFNEGLRGPPTSPRVRRQPSISQSAAQSLIDNPPARNHADPAFVNRDWRQISIGELVSPDDLKFVDIDTGIEEATNLLIDSAEPVLLIRENSQSKSAVGTFDYSDLNAYLLLAAGLTQPDEEHRISFEHLARKARDGIKIPLRDVKDLGTKNPLITISAKASVLQAVEAFGGGIHRVVAVDESADNEVMGVFSQFRLVKFLWENARNFPVVDQLYPQSLRDLRIGSHQVISINGDKPLCEALHLMNVEGISSLAVIDNQYNVIGNISTVDVKLLTRSSSFHLLRNTCTHFISVILSARGLVEGRDSFPVFYVNPTSTLAHAVAKMVATTSHRLWVTDPHSQMALSQGTPSVPYPSAHSTLPAAYDEQRASQSTYTRTTVSKPTNPNPNAQTNNASTHSTSLLQPSTALLCHTGGPPTAAMVPSSISASALPAARQSGRLVGVVSLTDILNLHARASGLNPADPTESRIRRRRSSSSSATSFRRSGDLAREIFSSRH